MSVSFLSLELNLKPYRKKIRTVQETLGVLAMNLGLEDQLYFGGRRLLPPALPWPGEWAAPPSDPGTPTWPRQQCQCPGFFQEGLDSGLHPAGRQGPADYVRTAVHGAAGSTFQRPFEEFPEILISRGFTGSC